MPPRKTSIDRVRFIVSRFAHTAQYGNVSVSVVRMFPRFSEVWMLTSVSRGAQQLAQIEGVL